MRCLLASFLTDHTGVLKERQCKSNLLETPSNNPDSFQYFVLDLKSPLTYITYQHISAFHFKADLINQSLPETCPIQMFNPYSTSTSSPPLTIFYRLSSLFAPPLTWPETLREYGNLFNCEFLASFLECPLNMGFSFHSLYHRFLQIRTSAWGSDLG